jgi:hypothetical protein
MAARFWALFLAGDLLTATGFAALVGHARSLSMPAVLSVELAALLALPALLVTASFVQAAAVDGSGDAGRLRFGPLLRALCAECLHFDRAVLAIVTARCIEEREYAMPAGRARPVLLIHGISMASCVIAACGAPGSRACVPAASGRSGQSILNLCLVTSKRMRKP